MKLSRDDLKDLFPHIFIKRKKLWDYICTFNGSSYPDAHDSPGPGAPSEETASTKSSGESSCDNSSESSNSSPEVQVLKRTKPREWTASATGKKIKASWPGANFTFPLSEGVKKCVKSKIPLNDKLRRELIRDCVTCLKASVGEGINTNHVNEAAKIICKEVPVMKDEKPPLWPEDMEFPYWASAKQMVNKRLANLKTSSKGKSASSATANEDDLLIETGEKDTEEDTSKHMKVLHKEFKKKGKNWKVIQQLLAFTFGKRREEIALITGQGAISNMLDKHAYLDQQRVVSLMA
ncbi:uncharacterized protein LOC116286638 [Actinia tenebrosa]|uniref:Uncharacterized protein LOC116286638 n=1 Tax=Actinia tenebrosa TaxID=6105 RepID=A0A6P8H9B8_ACTTE|nr:uncharacterized protein LOC116286638 [Actinia tenebrosa]